MNRSVICGTLAAGAFLALGGCAMQAHTDHDAKLSVATCHNYAFSDQQVGAVPVGAAFDNPLNAKRLRDAIASSLAARNIPAAAEGTNADCVVSYAIGSRLAPDPLSSQYAWGYGMPPPVGWGHYGWGGAVWGSPSIYREGRVSIDLYDAHSHQALWHAFVDTDVTELTGAEAETRIKAAVGAIFEKFPPLTAGSAIS